MAQQIKSGDGDYVLALKGNQGKLFQQVEGWFDQAIAWKIVELLKNPRLLAQERQRCRQIALTDTWERSAATWLDVIEADS